MGAARVVGLRAAIVSLPLRRPIRHASHARTSTDNIIVRCELNDGSIGWGEGVPREYVTGESADSALELLKSTDWKPLTGGCADFAAAVRSAESLTLSPVPGDDRQCAGNAARCAVELAFLDAMGRSFGENLTTVTELLAPELFEFHPRVQYSGAITSTQGWRLRALALGYRLTGFRHVKVKVGIAGLDDFRRLKTIRRCVGPKMIVRIDANEAWSHAECQHRIEALAPLGLDCVEQPVPHEQVAALANVRSQVNVPIMLDESLCSRVDAERAIAGTWCDRFNLRLSKCGGYIPTLRLAQLARQADLTYQLGCQVGESAILSGAGRHFACSVAGLTAIEGSFDRHLMKETLAYEDLTFGRGGWAKALTACGHGAWVDADAVDRLTRRAEKLL
jgi:muconate cycloisomerase